jgi:hypothetical protein
MSTLTAMTDAERGLLADKLAFEAALSVFQNVEGIAEDDLTLFDNEEGQTAMERYMTLSVVAAFKAMQAAIQPFQNKGSVRYEMSESGDILLSALSAAMCGETVETYDGHPGSTHGGARMGAIVRGMQVLGLMSYANWIMQDGPEFDFFDAVDGADAALLCMSAEHRAEMLDLVQSSTSPEWRITKNDQ